MAQARPHNIAIATEILTEKGLESRTGQNKYYWLRYAFKELIDNSLEANNDNVKIDITLNDEILIIKDNGQGIPKEVIYNAFGDLGNYTSTKSLYKLPSRGSQGNALLTIIGMQYVINQKPLEVTSNNIKYKIYADIHSKKTEIKEELLKESIGGFEVKLDIKDTDLTAYYQMKDTKEAYFNFVELNPQATFNLNFEDEEFRSEAKEVKVNNLYIASNKTTTGKAIWFNADSFIERVRADKEVAPKLKIKDFINEFYGLASYKKAKNIIGRLGWGNKKAIGQVNKLQARQLYYKMTKETKKFKNADSIGSIGEEGLKQGLIDSLKLSGEYKELNRILDDLKEVVNKDLKLDDLIVYKAGGEVKETDNEVIPYYFEMIAIPVTADKETTSNKINFGINQSFTYSTPSKQFELDINVNDNIKSLESAFNSLDYSYKVICNLTCPNLKFTDKGKQRFNIIDLEQGISKVLANTYKSLKRKVIRKINKLYDKKLKEHEEQKESLDPSLKAPHGLYKKFVFDFFNEIYNEATENGKYIITQRQLFYAMRPNFYKWCKANGWLYTNKATITKLKKPEFKYSTFEKNVTKYEKRVLGKRVVYKNDRGFFVEPHSNISTDLGTSSVENFIPKVDEYNNLLFVEKTGFYEMIHNDFKLTKKYDLGLICTQGFGNNAYRDLVEKIQGQNKDIKLYILTDFDIAGLIIADNAKKPDELSDRTKYFNCERIGITIDDVYKYNLESEPVNLNEKKKNEKNNTRAKIENAFKEGLLSEEEYNFLIQGQRVEINALKPTDLKKYLIDKIEGLGIEKVKPKEKAIRTPMLADKNIKKSSFKEAIGEFVLNEFEDDFIKLLEKEATIKDYEFSNKEKIQEEIYNKVLGELKELPVKGWKEINREIKEEKEREINNKQNKYKSEVKKQAEKILKEKVEIEIKIK